MGSLLFRVHPLGWDWLRLQWNLPMAGKSACSSAAEKPCRRLRLPKMESSFPSIYVYIIFQMPVLVSKRLINNKSYHEFSCSQQALLLDEVILECCKCDYRHNAPISLIYIWKESLIQTTIFTWWGAVRLIVLNTLYQPSHVNHNTCDIYIYIYL